MNSDIRCSLVTAAHGRAVMKEAPEGLCWVEQADGACQRTLLRLPAWMTAIFANFASSLRLRANLYVDCGPYGACAG